jgi:hypothetical protein
MQHRTVWYVSLVGFAFITVGRVAEITAAKGPELAVVVSHEGLFQGVVAGVLGNAVYNWLFGKQSPDPAAPSEHAQPWERPRPISPSSSQSGLSPRDDSLFHRNNSSLTQGRFILPSGRLNLTAREHSSYDGNDSLSQSNEPFFQHPFSSRNDFILPLKRALPAPPTDTALPAGTNGSEASNRN